MKRIISIIAVATTVLVSLAVARIACAEESTEATTEAATHAVPEDQWNDDAKLWLARSVIGEAGWRQFDEYSAIAFVYATRAEQSKRYDFLGMVKRYSAAVRAQGKRRQPWLFELGFEGKRPRSWPVDPATKTGPLWTGLHRDAWLETLAWADAWQAGERANPCEGANHFGGYIDRHRAAAARWVRIKCEPRTRNRFYTSLKLTGKRRRM